MKIRSFVVSQPLTASILLAIVVLIVPSLLIPYWYNTIKSIQRHVELNSSTFCSELQSEIEKTAELLRPMNSSATNLSRLCSSSLRGSSISYSDIEKSVAPLLFQGYSSIPHLSQISYIGLDGLFFSYYNNGNTTFSLYSNCTYNVGERDVISYSQPVDPDTGSLYGNASESSIAASTSVIVLQKAFNSIQGFASLGPKWDNSGDLLFLSTERINGTNGVVSLGFSVSAIAEFFTCIYRGDGILYLATEGGEVLVQGLESTRIVVYGNSVSFRLMNEDGDEVGQTENVSCIPRGTASEGSSLDIQGTNYTIYCSSLDILGVQSVYVLAFPKNRLDNLVRRSRNITLILFLVMVFTVTMCILSFVLVIVHAAKRDMCLRANLIRQMEATQQAHRKSVNKSNAFAKSSHDIRGYLAAMTGLIEECLDEASSGSQLHTNLMNMHACTKDLLRILNSVLDTSKIEAGKMQIEDEEFDLGQLLEDVVDLYHPLGMKKGIDVVLDPCDGSIIKFSRVRGDRGKLKQILCNLLGNAIKFTSEGHVSVQAWVKKPSLQDTIVASNKKGVLKHLCGLISKKEERKDVEAINRLQENSNFMEFVFEVDDTGKGIPKEKQESVFENYVQVKETALGQGGTGLGLGIVQSLVRLMGGDIKIMDKKMGEKGTCFRFNVFFTHCENVFGGETREEEQINQEGDGQQPKLTIRIPVNTQIFNSPSPRLAVESSSSKLKSSLVILVIQGDKRRLVTKTFMERLGIKVLAVKEWDQLPLALHTEMEKGERGRSESNSAHDSLSLSQTSSNGDKDNPPSAQDRRDCLLSVFKKISLRNSSGLVLLVIYENEGPFQELWRMITDLRRDLQISHCRVVWLKKPRDYDLNRNDVIITEPFHGRRLYDVIKLLPEFGGTIEDTESDKSTSSSGRKNLFDKTVTKNSSSQRHGMLGKSHESHSGNYSRLSQTNIQGKQTQHQEIQGEWTSTSSDKRPLHEKRVLVAEDVAVLRSIATKYLSNLGAKVDVCQNGKEALELYCKNLENPREQQGSSNNLPYDYILMDCEMPTMDGYEATRQIREIEKHKGIHTPIIALSANTEEEGSRAAKEAGMDGYISKPLNEKKLMEAIRKIHSRGARTDPPPCAYNPLGRHVISQSVGPT